jgi:exopolysaccharide biosynthesis polyprenyl glycosylphosphotransferase
MVMLSGLSSPECKQEPQALAAPNCDDESVELPAPVPSSFTKRAFDFGFALILLVLTAPLVLLLAVLIKLTSRGPAFYSQVRLGRNGRPYALYKLRTMTHNCERESGPQWSTQGDPRVTALGRFLRRSHLDELPQLWNVLRGDMSLVGPRPERPMYVEQFRASIPRYMLRHHVKSGMTGWEQVNGLRGDTPLERRIEYDLHYIKNWSLGFDVKILALTVARVFRDASAY